MKAYNCQVWCITIHQAVSNFEASCHVSDKKELVAELLQTRYSPSATMEGPDDFCVSHAKVYAANKDNTDLTFRLIFVNKATCKGQKTIILNDGVLILVTL